MLGHSIFSPFPRPSLESPFWRWTNRGSEWVRALPTVTQQGAGTRGGFEGQVGFQEARVGAVASHTAETAETKAWVRVSESQGVQRGWNKKGILQSGALWTEDKALESTARWRLNFFLKEEEWTGLGFQEDLCGIRVGDGLEVRNWGALEVGTLLKLHTERTRKKKKCFKPSEKYLSILWHQNGRGLDCLHVKSSILRCFAVYQG